jgi:hypothetical protein
MALTLPDGIEVLPITKWENAHQNFTHDFKPNSSFKLRIPHSDQPYQDTTKNFQWLIQYALDNNIQMRAIGNGWSFSEVAVCDGGVIDTKALRLTYNLNDSSVAPAYLQSGKTANNLFFVECGMSIFDINKKLEQESQPKRSLKASGASNGQSIAGATSTGTHGAAYNVGAVHDSIVGLHIVVSPTRHVWIEKESNPVASDEFINWLGAEPIRNDNMFNAAVVSFGSFGFIHGILLETEPVFLLEEHRVGDIAYTDAVKHTMNTLDFAAIEDVLPSPANAPGKELYHFEIIVNPQKFKDNDPENGVYFKLMYKVPYQVNYPKKDTTTGKFTYGDDTLGVIQTIIDNLGSNLSDLLIPPLVNKMFPLAFKVTGITYGTIGETFAYTKFKGKAASAAIGIPAAYATQLIETVVKLNSDHPFPGGMAMRYVKGTSALLGFTRFEKTCVLELDGVDSRVSRNFVQNVWDKLEELSIPYTLHWGKFNFNLDPQRIKIMYGSNAVDTWLNCRSNLLDANCRKVFTNDFMMRCGLA